MLTRIHRKKQCQPLQRTPSVVCCNILLTLSNGHRGVSVWNLLCTIWKSRLQPFISVIKRQRKQSAVSPGDLTQSCSDSTKTPNSCKIPVRLQNRSSPPPKIHRSPRLDGRVGQNSCRLSRHNKHVQKSWLAPNAGLTWQKRHFEGKKWHWTRRTLGKNGWGVSRVESFGGYMINVILKQYKT